jgi:hypothetical protein
MQDDNIEAKDKSIINVQNCTKSVKLKKQGNRITENEKEIIVALSISDWNISQISRYVNRNEKAVRKVVVKLQGVIERKKMDLLSRIEGKAIEKALEGKGDAQLIKFLLERKRPGTYGNRVEISKIDEPNKIVIRGYDGQLLETIEKPDADNVSNCND